MGKQDKHWEHVINAKSSRLSSQLRDLWNYRDLLQVFIRRDIVTIYKQTIFGPLWLFFQPLFTSLAFYFVFNKIGGIKTEGIPPILFYLSGITVWNYFAESVTKIASTFKDNQAILSKVYFPRLVIPLSIMISGLFKFLIQFSLFLLLYGFYLFSGHSAIHPQWEIALFPLLLLLTGGVGLGSGLLITSLTTKYRDLLFLLNYGIQLLMFATPVVYPLSSLGKNQWILLINPLSSVLETFRYVFLGVGVLNYIYLGISALQVVALLLIGVFVFSRTEKSVIDVI